MQVVVKLFGRLVAPKVVAPQFNRLAPLNQAELKVVSGGLPRVGPCLVTPVVAAEALPRVG